MLIDVCLIVLGFGLLLAGGEALVRGACGLALLLRITPAVVGLTIVAAGTSMPELVVSVQSALQERPGLAIGNVIGSNVFNIGIILGAAALVRPLRVEGSTVRLEWPVMGLAALQLYLLARDGRVDAFEGGCLLAAMGAFTAYSIRLSRQVTPQEQAEFGEFARATGGDGGDATWRRHALAIALGVALLASGSSCLVAGAASLAARAGISETIVGLTIVATGTSLPELVTSLVAALRGRDDVAVANVIGSNIFNVLGIMGVTALLHPVPVPQELLARDIWWMLAFSLVLFPLLRSGMRIQRWEGAFLLTGYAAYFVALAGAW